jgi:hypothetical protein
VVTRAALVLVLVRMATFSTAVALPSLQAVLDLSWVEPSAAPATPGRARPTTAATASVTVSLDRTIFPIEPPLIGIYAVSTDK